MHLCANDKTCGPGSDGGEAAGPGQNGTTPAIPEGERPGELILASASPRRSLLLREAGLVHRVVPAQVEEAEHLEGRSPETFVRVNTRLKGLWVAAREPAGLVLAADTTVSLDDHVLNKPADLGEARAMLRKLSGRTHEVWTAFSFYGDGGKTVLAEESVVSTVTFRRFDDAAIDRYFALVNPLDKAGAYGIQEGTDIILAGYEGSFTNIMGLPMETVLDSLARLGWLDLFRQAEV